MGHMTGRRDVTGSGSVVYRSSRVINRWTCVGGWRGSIRDLVLIPVTIIIPVVRIRSRRRWIIRSMMRTAPRWRCVARRRGMGGGRGMRGIGRGLGVAAAQRDCRTGHRGTERGVCAGIVIGNSRIDIATLRRHWAKHKRYSHGPAINYNKSLLSKSPGPPHPHRRSQPPTCPLLQLHPAWLP